MQKKVSSMMNNVQLFSGMYISCETRDGDLDTFMAHGNHAWPRSLAENNNMQQGNKLDPLPCLESLAVKPNNKPVTDVKIFKGAAVQMLDPKSGNTIVKTF